MRVLHLIYIPFTGVGLNGGYRGDKWFKERIEIFKHYTLKSLAAQTNQNFVVWISLRPQERDNPLVDELEYSLTKASIRYVITYHGLMYHDDKFDTGFVQRCCNIGRVIRQCYRNRSFTGLFSGITEILKNKNGNLKDRIKWSVADLPDADHTGHFYDWVYMTRLDSDDMFHVNFVEFIQEGIMSLKEAHDYTAVSCTDGYIHNTSTGEVAHWNPPTNPPFHTILFPASIFFDAGLHLAHYNGYKSHEDVTKVFKCYKLTNRWYCVTTSNPKLHISTIWNHPFRGHVVDRDTLKEFGL